MRVNEVINRCRTDQKAKIYYDGKSIEGTVFEIVDDNKFRFNRIGDMIVTNINSYNNYLILRVSKV